MRDLQEYFRKAMAIVEDCGIQQNYRIVNVTTLRKNAVKWGTCHMDRRFETAVIKINQKFLDESIFPADDGLINTLIHEILHACANFEDGHNGMWSYYADKVERMTGIKIRQYSSAEEKGMDEKAREDFNAKRIIKKSKYIIQCPKCMFNWGFARMCDKVKYPQHYRCGKCKTTLVRTF